MKNFSSLFVIPRYWPAVGGAELHTRELAQRMSSLHRVGVAHQCADEADLLEAAAAMSPGEFRQDGEVAVTQLDIDARIRPMLNALWTRVETSRGARRIYNLLLKKSIQPRLDAAANAFDIIHGVYNGLTPLTLAAMDTARKQSKPLVWTPLAHTQEPVGTAWSSPSFRAMYQRADALITMTQYEKDFLIEMGAKSDRVYVNPVSVLLEDNIDARGFRNRHGIEDAPMVLFLGRHVRDKGYQTLVQAAQAIWQSRSDTRLVFIGPGDHEADLFFSKINDSRIVRIPRISNEDKCSALASCDLLCVPSIKESLGVIYLEAWHYAKPVIAADLPVLKTVIDHGEDGLLCAPHADDVANSVIRLLGDAQLRASLGKAGQAKVRQRYHWQTIAADMHALYAELLQRFQFRRAA